MRARQPARPPFPNINAVTSQAESGGRDFTKTGAPVRSSKGAMFGMQVLPTTAGDPGYGVTPAKANTPSEFNRVGREYLAALHQRYGGDLAKMWAAYNWGPGKLDKLLSSSGSNWFSRLPQDVRNYVSSNIQALRGQ